MAATVRLYVETGDPAATTETNIDSDGGTNPRFGLDDLAVSTEPVQIPNETGTNFSRAKYVYLNVTDADTTSISNRRVRQSDTQPAGIRFWWAAESEYAQGTVPSSSGDNADNPGGMTQITNTATVYDDGDVNADLGQNGDYLVLVMGVDNDFGDGPGQKTFEDIIITYDEA